MISEQSLENSVYKKTYLSTIYLWLCIPFLIITNLSSAEDNPRFSHRKSLHLSFSYRHQTPLLSVSHVLDHMCLSRSSPPTSKTVTLANTDCTLFIAYPGIGDLEFSQDVLRHVVFSHGIYYKVLVPGRTLCGPVLMALFLPRGKKRLC